jgi:hypothetical protein
MYSLATVLAEDLQRPGDAEAPLQSTPDLELRSSAVAAGGGSSGSSGNGGDGACPGDVSAGDDEHAGLATARRVRAGTWRRWA